MRILPNLSRSGLDNIDNLVVAPISVNLGISILIEVAQLPDPIIISILKSSIAQYNISSI